MLLSLWQISLQQKNLLLFFKIYLSLLQEISLEINTLHLFTLSREPAFNRITFYFSPQQTSTHYRSKPAFSRSTFYFSPQQTSTHYRSKSAFKRSTLSLSPSLVNRSSVEVRTFGFFSPVNQASGTLSSFLSSDNQIWRKHNFGLKHQLFSC